MPHLPGKEEEGPRPPEPKREGEGENVVLLPPEDEEEEKEGRGEEPSKALAPENPVPKRSQWKRPPAAFQR